MALNMHGTQYGLSQLNNILQKKLKCNWLCIKTSKYNVKWAGSRYIAFPLRQHQRT